MNATENKTNSHHNSHFGQPSAFENQNNQQPESQISNFFLSLLSILLAPFYVIGLVLKSTINFIFMPINCVCYLLTGVRYSATNNVEVSQHIIETPSSEIDRRNSNLVRRRTPSPADLTPAVNNEDHTKFVACPACKHLHFSSSFCNCKLCVKSKPKLIECFKYHEKDAQLLMCPCIDCKHQRPMSEVCEHCVMVSQKVHVQARTPDDIEIRTRPRREIHL